MPYIHLPSGEVALDTTYGHMPSGLVVQDTSGGGDTTPPVLSSPTATVTGSSTADIGATTDEANGTLYFVATLSSTQPTKSQIINNQDHAGNPASAFGNVSVSSTGAKVFNASGLAPATAYYGYLVHQDAAGNQSNIVATGAFTTDAAASELAGNVTLDAVVAAGALGQAQGTCMVSELRNWAGALQAGVTIPVVTFCRLSDGVQVLTLTSQITDGSGHLSVSSTSLLAGTAYMVIGWNGDGSARFAAPVTAT